MEKLTKKDFEELANMHGDRLLSIYLPTSRAGQEVLNWQDQTVFKNLLAAIRKEMEDRGFSNREILEFMAPANELLADSGFWRGQAEGLAVFLAKDFLRSYSLPLDFEPYFYFSTHFYLKPLLPVLMENLDFYLLTLNLQEVKFYKGDRYGLEEVFPESVLPQRVGDVVGFDYQQKFLGYHTQSRGGNPVAIFHGHGDWKEDEKDEILAFFRAIDKTIGEYLTGATAPLVVASLDYLFPLYEKANTYKYLIPEHLSGSPKHVETGELHRKAWDLLTFGFEKIKTEKLNLFNQFQDTRRTSTDIQEIIPAAISGLIDTLFLAKDLEIWGIYDQRDATTDIYPDQNPSNTSLTNLAAVSVFRNGGLVYLQEEDELPHPASGINALFRY